MTQDKELEIPEVLIIRAKDIDSVPGLNDELTKVMNKGYNKPRYKFNVILSPRVKATVFNDIAEGDPDCLFLLCMAPSVQNMKAVAGNTEASIFTKTLIEKYPLGSIQLDCAIEITKVTGSPKALESHITYSIQRLSELSMLEETELSALILGTSGIKTKRGEETETVRSSGVELTGFTSFYPGISPFLMEYSKKLAKDVLGFQKLVSCAIEEHQLEDYYSKFGFVKLDRIVCKVDKKTNRLVGEAMEDGVLASQDFHLVVLVAEL